MAAKKTGKKEDPKKAEPVKEPLTGLSVGVITLDEYNFPHAVYIYDGPLVADNMILGFHKCYMAMNLE